MSSPARELLWHSHAMPLLADSLPFKESTIACPTYRAIFYPQNFPPYMEKGPKKIPIFYKRFFLGPSGEASWLLPLKNAQMRSQHTLPNFFCSPHIPHPNFTQLNSAFQALPQTKANKQISGFLVTPTPLKYIHFGE